MWLLMGHSGNCPCGLPESQGPAFTCNLIFPGLAQWGGTGWLPGSRDVILWSCPWAAEAMLQHCHSYALLCPALLRGSLTDYS